MLGEDVSFETSGDGIIKRWHMEFVDGAFQAEQEDLLVHVHAHAHVHVHAKAPYSMPKHLLALLLEGSKECPVCFEPLTETNAHGTICGHVFCKDCIFTERSVHNYSCPETCTMNHAKQKLEKCPVCRCGLN
jgi:hypothetical protein